MAIHSIKQEIRDVNVIKDYQSYKILPHVGGMCACSLFDEMKARTNDLGQKEVSRWKGELSEGGGGE
jgi:hypothetical protein